MGDLISYPLANQEREAVRQLLEAFEGIWPNSTYGPMHILIADFNALDHNLAYCKRWVKAMLAQLYSVGFDPPVTNLDRIEIETYEPHDKAELQASLLLIDMLELIPEDQRDIHDWANEFDEESTSGD